MIYDLVVVGAGIAGCSIANYAKSKGKKVLIIDRASSVATGGSGAAGAFISPKLGKESNLLNLTNLAFNYASKFYSKNFSQYFDNSGIIRILKDSKDAKNIKYYQSLIKSDSKILTLKDLKELGIKSDVEAIYFSKGGVCDAQGLCKALIKDINFLQLELNDIKYLNSYILLNKEYKAKNIVLATGYEGYKDLLNYMGIKGLWGSRGDFYTTSHIKYSLHKDISISANRNGVVKIGATHIRAKNPCLVCDGKPLNPLINRAKELVELKSLELKETFCGMRSGSRDYFPLVGKVIDYKIMLEDFPNIKKGFSKAPLKYLDNIYVFNGLGGRGFVFAPLLAKWLYELIFNNIEISPLVNPNRLFFKWARKL